MKQLCLLLALSVFANELVYSPSKKHGAGPLFRIRRGPVWGYMDRTGKTVIEPQFTAEGDFFDGLARVENGGQWGYINEQGRLAIRQQFDDARDFSGGIAPVRVSRMWGFINKSGVFVVQPQFQGAAEFSDGVARVEVWDSTTCSPDGPQTGDVRYTNKDAPPRAFAIWMPGEQMGTGCFAEGARFGYIDARGRAVVPPTFRSAQDFSDGLAAVRLKDQSKWSYIDQKGNIVIPARFNEAHGFSNGFAAVRESVEDAWQFIGRDGKPLTAARFGFVLDFSEGLAAVSNTGGDWGFIDTKGRIAIQLRYAGVGSFSEGLAGAGYCERASSCYIDKAGNEVLNIKLSGMSWPFSDGLAVVGSLGEGVYIDRKGQVVAAYESDAQR